MSLIQKMLVVLLISLVIAFIAKSQAQTQVQVGSLAVTDIYARSTVSGQKNAAGFLSIQNNGPADKLLSASSSVSGSVEIHEMKMDGNVMQMRSVQSLDVPAKSKVELRPGGYHLMFIELKSPLKAGESINVQLQFEKAGKVSIKMPIQEMRPMHGGPHGPGSRN